MRVLFLLLSGNPKEILENSCLEYSDISIIKVDEKSLSNPRFILSLMNRKKFNYVIFGNKDNELQRFQIFMKVYIFISLICKGSIKDELGKENRFNIIKLLFLEIPQLIFEAIVTLFVISYFYIKLPLIKWKLMKKS